MHDSRESNSAWLSEHAAPWQGGRATCCSGQLISTTSFPLLGFQIQRNSSKELHSDSHCFLPGPWPPWPLLPSGRLLHQTLVPSDLERQLNVKLKPKRQQHRQVGADRPRLTGLFSEPVGSAGRCCPRHFPPPQANRTPGSHHCQEQSGKLTFFGPRKVSPVSPASDVSIRRIA